MLAEPSAEATYTGESYAKHFRCISVQKADTCCFDDRSNLCDLPRLKIMIDHQADARNPDLCLDVFGYDGSFLGKTVVRKVSADDEDIGSVGSFDKKVLQCSF